MSGLNRDSKGSVLGPAGFLTLFEPSHRGANQASSLDSGDK